MLSIIQCTVAFLLCMNCLSAEKAVGCFALHCLKLCTNVNWFYDDLTTTIPIQCQHGLIRLDWIMYFVPSNQSCSDRIGPYSGKDSTTCRDSLDKGCKVQSEETEALKELCDQKQKCDLTIKARNLGHTCQNRLAYNCYYYDEKIKEYVCYSTNVQVTFSCVQSKYRSIIILPMQPL